MTTKYARSIRRFAMGWSVLMLLVAVATTAPAWGGASSSPITYYGDGLLPLTTTVDGANSLNIRGPGGPVATLVTGRGGDGVHYPLTDHLGSTRITLDPAAGTEVSHEYGPYGTTAIASARDLYAGHPYDASRGLYETPERDYEPASGRFLATDPGRQDASPYLYAGDDPVNYLDPDGGVRVPYFMKSGYPGKKNYLARSVAEVFGIHPDQKVRDTATFRRNKSGYSNAGRIPKRLLYGDTMEPGRRKYEYSDMFFWTIDAHEKVPDAMSESLFRIRDVESSFARKFVMLDFTRKKGVRRAQRALEASGESVLRIRSEVITRMEKRAGPFAEKFVVGGEELTLEEFRSYVDDKIFEKWPSQDVVIPRWMLKPEEGSAQKIKDPPSPDSLLIRQALIGWPRAESPPESSSLELPVSIPLQGLTNLRSEESWRPLPPPPPRPPTLDW